MAAGDLLEPLQGQREVTMRVVDSLDDGDLDRIDRESGRSVRQILAHVAEARQGEAFVIRLAHEGDVIHLSDEERERLNETEMGTSVDWPLARIRAELIESQAALREVFASMTDDDLDLPIRWPEWPARTIRTSIPYMLEHEDSHLDAVRRALER